MQKKISTLIGIIIIVAVALVAFGGVFAWQRFNEYPFKTGPLIINQDSGTAGPALSDVEGWKTYTNAQSGLSFQYPQAWAEPKLVLLSTRVVGAFINGSISQYDNGFTFEIGVYYDQTKGRNLTVEEIINNIKNQSYISKTTQQNITVGGKNAVRIEYTYNTGGKITQIYVPLDTKGNILEVSSDTNVIGSDTFDRVVSTFKFTK